LRPRRPPGRATAGVTRPIRCAMRDKSLLQLFLVLNAALAACFAIYLLVSANRQPQISVTSFAPVSPKTNTLPSRPAIPVATNSVERAHAEPADTNVVAVTVPTTNAPAATNPVPAEPVFTPTPVGWQQLEADSREHTEKYKSYLNSLRAVGCPEDK